MVEVFGLRKAHPTAGFVERALRGVPVLALEPVADDRAVGPVEVVVKVHVRLELAEEGQDALELPLVVAQRCPCVEVVGQATKEHLAVDGAGPSGYLSPGDQHGEGDVVGLARKLPVVVVANHDIGTGRVPELELVGQVLEVRVVGAGFKQEHRAMRIF